MTDSSFYRMLYADVLHCPTKKSATEFSPTSGATLKSSSTQSTGKPHGSPGLSKSPGSKKPKTMKLINASHKHFLHGGYGVSSNGLPCKKHKSSVSSASGGWATAAVDESFLHFKPSPKHLSSAKLHHQNSSTHTAPSSQATHAPSSFQSTGVSSTGSPFKKHKSSVSSTMGGWATAAVDKSLFHPKPSPKYLSSSKLYHKKPSTNVAPTSQGTCATSSIQSTGQHSTRHSAGFVPDRPIYVPIRDFVKDFVPEKSCAQYILQDCAAAFDEVKPNSDASQFLPTLVKEAKEVTASLLQHVAAPGGEPAKAFAIVCYTMDMRQLGAKDHQNFFHMINRALQTRDPTLLLKAQGYLHFLFSGLQSLPAMPKQRFYRGLPADCKDTLQNNYKAGVAIHWSGLTSVSSSEEVAKEFASKNGCIIRIEALSARSIQHLTTYPNEEEALLLPNFKAVVTKELFKRNGYYFLEILETHETFTF